MRSESPQRRRRSGGAAGLAALALGLLALAQGAPAAQAATKPRILALWSTEVVATSARLRAEINPGGAKTAYHFDYLTQAAYEANLAASREAFYGAAKVPSGTDPSIEGSATVAVYRSISNLNPQTAYRYRVVAQRSEGAAESEAAFTTQGLGGGVLLADSRGWEMVSPLDKNGGQVQGPGQIAGGGAFQAAAGGGAIAYSSTASFGEGAGGAPYASQYVSRRGESGWSTQNVTAPMLSGSYGEHPDGVPYQLFSADLARGLLLNGEHCRSEATSGCPIANPPPPGSGAPEGFQDYYLRNDESGAYSALLTEANKGPLGLSSSEFDLALAGATPNLGHVVLSSCAKLTSDATEVAATGGCDQSKQNLYEWSGGALSLVNLLPGEAQGTPGAKLAAQATAISEDGSRVYFEDAGNLYLREGSSTHQLDEAQGGGGSFQAASTSGDIAFFTKEGHLYRYLTASHSAADLTPAGGVVGVLGISGSGTYAYYQDASGLERWHEGTTTQIAAGSEAAQESDWPPTTGSARVLADGTELLFLSSAPKLTGYDNTDQTSPAPCGSENEKAERGVCDSELYLWSSSGGLACLSCNPTNERPLGPSTIPGAYANGQAPGSTRIYKPHVLSVDGRRVFFESSDALVLSDTDKAPDVYEWEAQGEGSCQTAGGCLSLISSGRAAGGGRFLDASATGADAFFLTEGSLVPSDPGSADVYDARVGGGFPEVPSPIPCNGDACQVLPPEPEDPEPGSLREGPGNPPLAQPKQPRCRKGYVRKHGRCVRRHHHKRKHRR